MTSPVPDDVASWIGETRYAETADFPVERGYIWTSCASVENGNPLFWDDEVASDVTGGPIAPPSTLSLWFRPHHWQPGQTSQKLPLQVHFDLKERLGLPEAIMSDSEVVFHEPVRPGDVVSTSQVLRSLSDPKTTKLGTGRFWIIDVPYRNQDDVLVGVETFTGFGYVRAEQPSSTSASAATPMAGATAGSGGAAVPGTAATTSTATATSPAATAATPATAETGTTASTTSPTRPATGLLVLGDVAERDLLPALRHDVTATTVVLGALATRDWRPMHHDRDFAIERNGARDIFLNTPNQQAWFERFVTDWTGPLGRPGRLHFRMRDSVYPGETMELTGRVAATEIDAAGCGWATVAIEVRATTGERREPEPNERDGTGADRTAVDAVEAAPPAGAADPESPTDHDGEPGRLCTTATVRIALPTSPDDNPWRRAGDRWAP